MGLSMEQRRYHEIHDIGINDFLTRFFNSRAEDITFKQPPNWPTQIERYELTMGRTGYIGDKSPEYSIESEDSGVYEHYIDQYLSKSSCIGCDAEPKKQNLEPQATTDYQLDKKYWLSQAIQHSLEDYGSMFSPGQMIKLNDTAMVWHESEWGKMVKTVGIPEKDKFWTTKGGLISMRDLSIYNEGHYCHKNDTALVIEDQVRCRVVIRNVEEWTGSVQFFRVVELLLTRFTPGDHVNPPPWTEPLEAEATRVKLILSPHKLAGSGQQDRLFTRMTETP